MFKIILFTFLFIASTNSFCQTNFWTQTNGPFGGTVYDYSFGEKNVVYAAADRGVYKSTDNGVTWDNIGFEGTVVLSICKLSSGNVIAGVPSQGIYISTNEGTSWDQSYFVGGNVNDIKEINPSLIIAATHFGILKSTNLGSNWLTPYSGINAFSIDVSSNNEIYVSAFEGIYKSTDLGNNWTKLMNFNHTYVTSVDVSINGYIFATTWNGVIYRSTDNGASFTDLSLASPIYKTTKCVSTNDGYIYCGTFYQGIWKSTNYGDSWLKQYPGERTNFFVTNLCEGFNGNVFAGVALGGNGVIRTTDHGEHWYGFRFRHSHIPTSILMKSSDGKIFSNTGHISTDNGLNWTYADFDFQPSSFAMNGSNGYLFATDKSSNSSYFSWVFRSTNNGEIWQILDLDTLCYWIYGVFIARSGNVYVSATGGGLLKSTTNGTQWFNVSSYSPKSISENNLNHIFVMRHDGVFRSTNNGQNWELMLSLSSNGSIYISNSNNIFASGDNTLFKSSNNGNNWTQENITGTVTSIIENQSGRIFISLYSEGVYYKDKDSWVDITYTLDRNVNTLCFNSLGQLLAGTATGVYKTNQSIISVDNTNQNTPDKFILYQNFPNPFNPNTIINYELPITNYVILKVYDALGKEVATLVNKKQNAGSYEIEFGGDNLSSGIYYFTLKTDNYTETKRMVLLK